METGGDRMLPQKTGKHLRDLDGSKLRRAVLLSDRYFGDQRTPKELTPRTHCFGLVELAGRCCRPLPSGQRSWMLLNLS